MKTNAVLVGVDGCYFEAELVDVVTHAAAVVVVAVVVAAAGDVVAADFDFDGRIFGSVAQ